MVKIRLARFGRKNVPFFRLVAVQAKTKRNGEVIEQLGTYEPKLEKNKLNIKKDRVEYWLSVGAQPTDTVHHLLAKEGILKPLKKKYKKAPGKNKSSKLEADKAKAEAPKAEEKKEEVKSEEPKAEEAKPEEPKTEAPAETPAEAPAPVEAPAEVPAETPASEATQK